MLNADAVMERAVNLYNANSNVTNLSQAKAIIESLKLFVRVSQLDNEDNEDQSSMLRPKILMFIALCNYKIDNINRAYCIAKQGLDAVDKATRNSVFSGIPRSMYGADTLEELIGVIENNRFDEVEDDGNYYDIDPEEIDTSKFEEILSRAGVRDAKPSKSQIKQLIETISHIQSQFSKVGERTGDSLRAFEINQTLETFKIPLCLAWQGYKYGWHTDFSKEGDSLFPFMMFEMDLKKNTKQLIDILRRQSPFATIERNSAITNALIAVYTTFIKKNREVIIMTVNELLADAKELLELTKFNLSVNDMTALLLRGLGTLELKGGWNADTANAMRKECVGKLTDIDLKWLLEYCDLHYVHKNSAQEALLMFELAGRQMGMPSSYGKVSKNYVFR